MALRSTRDESLPDLEPDEDPYRAEEDEGSLGFVGHRFSGFERKIPPELMKYSPKQLEK